MTERLKFIEGTNPSSNVIRLPGVNGGQQRRVAVSGRVGVFGDHEIQILTSQFSCELGVGRIMVTAGEVAVIEKLVEPISDRLPGMVCLSGVNVFQ